MSLSDLANSLNPGGAGTGAQSLNEALNAISQQQGGDMFTFSELDQKPRPISQVAPKYPPALQRQNIGGTVTVSFVVDANGRVVNPKVEQSPNPAFDKVALDAIKQWRFDPGMKDGKKVPFKMRIPFKFAAG